MSKGILLVNLGSPDSTSVPDVRRYLRQFLMDGRVIDVAWPLRALIVGTILINRPKATAHAYQSIWTKAGSPLIVTSRNVLAKLQERIKAPLALAMRYQNPSIEAGVDELRQRGVDEILLIPLFPHYAMSSYESAVEEVKRVLRQAGSIRLRVQPPYYDQPDYIAALVASAGAQLDGGYDHLLFSFHGVPERQIKKSDPTGCHCLAAGDCCDAPSRALPFCYRAQCLATMRAFVRKAGVPPEKYSFAFQSRLGRDPWLKPYTDFELEALPKKGVKNLLVICPAFVSDCLETIEEIGLRGRESFLSAGGTKFAQIPCLNEHPAWVAVLERMAGKFLAGTGPGNSPA